MLKTKINSQTFLFIIVIFIILTSLGAFYYFSRKSSDSGFEEYRSPNAKIALEYPVGWTVEELEENSENSFNIIVFSPDKKFELIIAGFKSEVGKSEDCIKYQDCGVVEIREFDKFKQEDFKEVSTVDNKHLLLPENGTGELHYDEENKEFVYISDKFSGLGSFYEKRAEGITEYLSILGYEGDQDRITIQYEVKKSDYEIYESNLAVMISIVNSLKKIEQEG